jgi:tetratricopeptide (TPR) repeat protein
MPSRPLLRRPRRIREPLAEGSAVPRRRSAAPLLALFSILTALAACAGGRPAPAPPRAEPKPLALPQQGEDYLLDPTAGSPDALDPDTAARLHEAHAHLLAAGDLAGAESVASEFFAADPDLAAPQVLLAQVEFARGQYREAVARLEPLARAHPAYAPAQLLLGRAAELLGDLPAAYAAYRVIAAREPLAFERTGALHGRVLEITANRVQEAVRAGDLGEARRQLALLSEWGPSEELTFEAARQVAVAEGDLRAELAAVQPLSRRRPRDRQLLERRAELELEVGDPGKGLEIVQELATRHPGDAALAEKLEAAKFRWRVSLLPPGVQAVVAKPSLSRSELAVLLYWLVPSVRHARPGSGRIATDVLDHPHQEELVRVVNLGLLDVDARLHRVFPDGAARRGTALRSLHRMLWLFAKEHPCLAGAGADPPQSALCGQAARCGLIASEEDCRPKDPLSGTEAVELIRRSLEILGAE